MLTKARAIDHLSGLIHDDERIAEYIDGQIRKNQPGYFPERPVSTDESWWTESLEFQYYTAHGLILSVLIGNVLAVIAPLKD